MGQHKHNPTAIAGKKRYSENENKKKWSTKKKVIVGAAITAGLLATGIGAYKLATSNSRSIDRTMKIGKDFYRQAHKMEKENGLNEVIYASLNKAGNKFYKNAYAGTDHLDIVINSKEKIKIAGTKSGERIFKDLLKKNSEFASHYGNMTYSDFNGSIGIANPIMIKDKISLKDTYAYPFFKELASKGYTGMIDVAGTGLPVVLINEANKFFIK